MFQSLWSSLSSVQAGLFVFVFGITLVLLINRVTTHLSYRRALNRIGASKASEVQVPPVLPYTIPWLGLAIPFTSTVPGKFWRGLDIQLKGSNAKACTVILAGIPTHLLLSGKAIQSLFRSRKSQADREALTEQTVVGVFDCTKDDYKRLYHQDEAAGGGPGEAKYSQDVLHGKYLLSNDAVNALTSQFMRRWQKRLDQDTSVTTGERRELDLVAWVQEHMFVASTESILGSRILEEIPDLMPRFWYFDQTFLSFLYGMPRWMKRKEYDHRDHLIADMERWLEKMIQEAGMPDERTLPDWTECFGSKITQARTRLFEYSGITHRGIASLHLGFLFG